MTTRRRNIGSCWHKGICGIPRAHWNRRKCDGWSYTIESFPLTDPCSRVPNFERRMAVGGKPTGQLVSQARIGVVVSWIRNGRHGFVDLNIRRRSLGRHVVQAAVAKILLPRRISGIARISRRGAHRALPCESRRVMYQSPSARAESPTRHNAKNEIVHNPLLRTAGQRADRH